MAAIRRIETPTDPTLVGPITVTACSSADPNCSHPTVPSDAVTIDTDVTVTAAFVGVLPSGFSGAIRILSAAGDDAGTASDFLPYYRHFTAETPLVGDMAERSPVLLVGADTFALLAGIAAVSFDPSAGIVGLQVYDCGARPAADVSMVPIGTTDYLFLPLSGMSTPLVGATETTEEGFALLINLPPDRTLTFILRDEREQRLITSTLSLIVHGAAFNDVTYYPRYSAFEKGLEQIETPSLE